MIFLLDFLLQISPQVFLYLVLGIIFGIFVGALPGFSATMATAILVPFTYYLDPLCGLSMIIGSACTSIFAGDIPAVYMRIPGTPASGAMALDGYELSKKGYASLVLSIDLWGSAIGGMIGVIILIVGSRAVASAALHFTHFEYFWLIIFGLLMSVVMSKKSLTRGMISLIIGIFASMIGVDIVSGFPRFTFDNPELLNGVNFIPAMIGLFGIPVILSEALRKFKISTKIPDSQISLSEGIKTLSAHKGLVLQSSLIGTIIGALPGLGADVAAWISYGLAERVSKNSKDFGKGSIEGVISPPCANNAALAGTWIPMLTLGIPGDSITAIILGAAVMYGLKPGPFVFSQSGDLVYGIFLIFFVAQLLIIPLGYIGMRAFRLFFKLPKNLITPLIFIFCVVGSYSIRNSVFDVWIMLLFGVLGVLMESADIPLTPLVLGLILGPMLEENLRVGLIKTGGNILPFVTRPICVLLISVLVLVIIIPRILSRAKRSKMHNQQ